MLTSEQTKLLVDRALKNPKKAHLEMNLPELYASVDKHLDGLKLTQDQWDTLGSIYTKLALNNSPIKAKMSSLKLKEIGIAKVESATDAKALEALAEVFHDAWMHWSKSVASDIKDQSRIQRWQGYWVPYEQLDAKTKDLDREWADKALKGIKPHLKSLSSKELVMKVDSKYTMLKKVLAAGRAEAHCFTTWHEGLRHLEQAQTVFNKAMGMAATENMPVEMKAQLADFVASVYNLQSTATELFEELREVDQGAPPAPKEKETEE